MIRNVLFALAALSQPDCVRAAHGVVACKELAEAGYVLNIRRGDRLLYSARREPGPLEVFLRDLDADGRAEIVAADSGGTSNGLGIHYWDVTIVDGRTAAAIAVPIQDYGPGSLRRDGLLVTHWEWIGDHLYFVSRPFRYERGKLTHRNTMWQRRLLYSFQEERFRGCGQDPAKGCPGQWLRKATAVPWRDQPPE